MAVKTAKHRIRLPGHRRRAHRRGDYVYQPGEWREVCEVPPEIRADLDADPDAWVVETIGSKTKKPHPKGPDKVPDPIPMKPTDDGE